MSTNNILLFIIIVLLLLLFKNNSDISSIYTHNILNNKNDQFAYNNQILNKNKQITLNNTDYTSEKINSEIKNYEINKLKEQIMENKIRTRVLEDNRDANVLRYNRVHDPLTAPEMSHPFMMNRNKVPINIETRGKSMEYQQIGFIHSESGDENIIYPLYGKELWRGSSKWSYYTGTDKIHQIKLPIVHNKRQCMSEHGCDQLYEGDEIEVPPYNNKFKVQLYNLDAPKYIPL